MRNCTNCGSAVAGKYKYCEDCREQSSPWRPDELNIRRACKELGIKLPVKIRRTSGGKHLAGRYYGISVRNEHEITVASRLSPKMASQVIWHELTHAKQREFNSDFHKNYASATSSRGYMSNMYEQEAKANEDYHDSKFALTRPNKRVNLSSVRGGMVLSALDGRIVYTDKYYKYMSANDRAIERAKSAIGRK